MIAYSGDTARTDALLEAAAGADLFISEAYFYEKQVPYHLDYQTLAGQRGALGCRRLILTHMSADMLRRLPVADAEAADDGMIVTL